MPPVLRIPSGLRRSLNGVATVEMPCGTLGDSLSQLDLQFPGLKDRLLDENYEVHSFISIFVNGNDISYLQGLHTPLSDGDEVIIVPSIGGGASTRVSPCSAGRDMLS